MNRHSLFQAPHSCVEFDAIAYLLKDKKILILDGYQDHLLINAHKFFDIIIGTIPPSLHLSKIDFYFDTRSTPYNDGVLDLSLFDNKRIIFILNHEYIDVLKKIKIMINAAVLVSSIQTSVDLYNLLCKCCQTVLRTSVDSPSITQIMSAHNKYGIYSNIIYSSRKSFLEMAWS